MKIEIRTFSGIAPRFSPELLNEQNGQKAVNISIKSGKIHPEKKFIIKYPDRDYVPGQINDDQYNRLYFLDEKTLCVCGNFYKENQEEPTLNKRIVNITAPGKPSVISVTSPFLEKINIEDLNNNGEMIANYGTTSWKSKPGVATHIYSEYSLKPITKWNEKDNNTLERIYQYNPWNTEIDWEPGTENNLSSGSNDNSTFN